MSKLPSMQANDWTHTPGPTLHGLEPDGALKLLDQFKKGDFSAFLNPANHGAGARPSSGKGGNQTKMPRITDERGMPKEAIDDAYERYFAYLEKPLSEQTKEESMSAFNEVRIFIAVVWRKRGNELLKQGKLQEARDAYATGIRRIWVPTREMEEQFEAKDFSITQWPMYPMMSRLTWIDAIACAYDVLQCDLKMGDLVKALESAAEIHRMYLTYATNPPDKAYPWMDSYLQFEEFVTGRIRVWADQAEIYRKLGNTAAAYAACLAGTHFGDLIFTRPEPREVKEARDKCRAKALLRTRHPEPNTTVQLAVTEPMLQVRGAWRKVHIPGADDGEKAPTSRSGNGSVVWKGKYYIFGGEHAGSGRPYKCSWVLDLHHVAKGWRKLPECPLPSHLMEYLKAALYKGKAYIFTGTPVVTVFDLENEKWETFTTTLANSKLKWERDIVPGHRLRYTTVQVIGDTMYVFGGTDKDNIIGRNTLLRLDFVTAKWNLLSGRPELLPEPTLPGPREYACSWVVGDKLYISLGGANRTAADMKIPYDFSYSDIWSYDTAKNKWTQERVRGNPPCLRTESGYTFNEKWGKVVVFGGYCPSMPFKPLDHGSSGASFGFSYFGDTFVWSAETQSWSMVLTRGFPTYRAQADMFTDQETGKTYLFGGYTNTWYIPVNRSAVARSFADVWELVIDAPNGGFDSFERDDPKFVKLGPWQPCWTCKSVGQWAHCNGSCRKTNRNAAFCSVDCQKAGWKEHKQVDGCRKI